MKKAKKKKKIVYPSPRFTLSKHGESASPSASVSSTTQQAVGRLSISKVDPDEDDFVLKPTAAVILGNPRPHYTMSITSTKKSSSRHNHHEQQEQMMKTTTSSASTSQRLKASEQAPNVHEMNKKKVDSKNNKPETNKQPLPTKTEKAKTPGREEKVDKVLNTPTATSANLRNTTTADSSTSSVSTAAKDSHHQQGDAEEYNLDDLEEKSASLVNNHNNSNNKNETSIQGNDQQQAEGEMEFASKEKEFIDKEREFTDKVKQMGQIKSDPEGDQQNNPDDVKKLVVGDQEPSGSTSTNPGDGAVDHQSSITSATERLKMKGFVNVTEETQSVLSQQPTGTDPSKMTNNLHDSLTADPIKSVNNHSQVLGVGDVKGPLSPLTAVSYTHLTLPTIYSV